MLKVNPYTPSEAALITGRSVENQRNDRRAGYSPEHHGHARYDLLALCRLYCVEAFAAKDVGPMLSVKFADEVAAGIAPHLLMRREVWSASAIEAVNGPSDVTVGNIMKAMNKSEDAARKTDEEMRVTALALKVDADALKVRIGRGVVVWANGEHEVGEGLWRRTGELAAFDPKVCGVVNSLLFFPAAIALVSRLPRPLFYLVDEG